jgi:hypothetical protein
LSGALGERALPFPGSFFVLTCGLSRGTFFLINRFPFYLASCLFLFHIAKPLRR